MWILLALAVAVFTSLQDILSKRLLQNVHPAIVTWGWWFFSVPFLYIAFAMEAKPVLSPTFWWLIVLNTLLLTAAVSWYIKAIQISDLSLTVPLMTFTPLFLLATSPLILKEFPSKLGMVGVVLIAIGSYILFSSEHHRGWLTPLKNLFKDKGARYMFAVATVYSVTANIDKAGVINSSPLAWPLIANAALSLGLMIVMFAQRAPVVSQVKSHLGLFLGVGFCNAAALVIQMQAIQMTQVPYLIAVKRMSVVMTSLFGFIFLKEKDFLSRMIGIVVMVVGVFFIMFGLEE